MIALVFALLLPAHYAELFKEGATFTYDVSITTWDAKLGEIDTQKVPMKKWPRHTAKHVATCTVSKVVTLGAATASLVTCDKEIDPKFHVAGVYIATERGLHRGGSALPASADELSDLEPPIIAAKPRKRTSTTREKAAGDTQFVVTDTIRQVGRAWCVSRTFKGAPHDGTERTCYGGTVTRGGNDIAGELHDVQFTLRR